MHIKIKDIVIELKHGARYSKYPTGITIKYDSVDDMLPDVETIVRAGIRASIYNLHISISKATITSGVKVNIDPLKYFSSK